MDVESKFGMENITEDLLKMDEVNVGEVRGIGIDVEPERAITREAKTKKLCFKGIPLDIKRMVFSYVRKAFSRSFVFFFLLNAFSPLPVLFI